MIPRSSSCSVYPAPDDLDMKLVWREWSHQLQGIQVVEIPAGDDFGPECCDMGTPRFTEETEISITQATFTRNTMPPVYIPYWIQVLDSFKGNLQPFTHKLIVHFRDQLPERHVGELSVKVEKLLDLQLSTD